MNTMSAKKIDLLFIVLQITTGLEKNEFNEFYLSYNYSSVCGGYSIFLCNFECNTQSNFAGISALQRYKAKEFHALLSGLIAGIDFANKNL